MSERGPGPVILFGSGEISASAQAVYDALLRRMGRPYRVAVLETPAGFELNSDRVAGRVADYLRGHLLNYSPEVMVIPARRRGASFSPDDPQIVAPLLRARVIFLGPGSPTYAVRQLKDSLAWQMLLARHRLGAAVVLASAATIAASAQALPVYEIYKAGQDLHWVGGLDLFAAFGLHLVLVPHWNNSDGGAELDTSRCFMGQARFAELLALLPPGLTVLGIDEYTALMLDLQDGACRVMAGSGVTLLCPEGHKRYTRGQSFPLTELGPFRQPEPCEGIAPAVWEQALASARRDEERQAEGEPVSASPDPPAEVLALVEDRESARARRDWPSADALRERILALGWQVSDAPAGPRLQPMSGEGES